MERIAVGDVSLAVTEAGAGPPVVFVHGFPELAFSWRHQLPAVAAAGYRAVAYDQRGYGESDKPGDVAAYGLHPLVGDLVGLLDAFGWERATLVGHDWGSIVVWAAAVHFPKRVERIVSLNVPYRGWCCGFPNLAYIREHLADRFGYVLAFQEPGGVEARFAADPEGWLRAVFTGVAADAGFLTDAVLARYRDAFVAGGIAGPVSYYRNIDANWEECVPFADVPVTVPTMLVVPDADPVLPATLAAGMERWVPNLRVGTVAGCGHWTQQERPERVNELLLEFLED